MNEGVNLDAVNASLRSVKLLRCNVRDLFRHLTDGSDQNLSTSEQKEENNFINDLQQLVGSVNQRVRELENSCSALTNGLTDQTVTLGNTSFIGQDPHQEKTLLYGSMVASYRWCDRAHEVASIAYTILNAGQMKRTLTPSSGLRGRFSTARRPLATGHAINVAQVDSILHMLMRMFSDLKLEVQRPFGQPTVLKITLDRVMKVLIVLRGLICEWVLVKGYSEQFEDCNGKLDMWTESRYEVFRKITDHANSAILHFCSPVHPDLALKSFVHWINSYQSLFVKPCKKCELRLKHNLPPTWRDTRSLEPYHEHCKA